MESFFSSFKRWFGEYVSSVKFENIRKELAFKVMIKSMFLSSGLGMLEDIEPFIGHSIV